MKDALFKSITHQEVAPTNASCNVAWDRERTGLMLRILDMQYLNLMMKRERDAAAEELDSLLPLCEEYMSTLDKIVTECMRLEGEVEQLKTARATLVTHNVELEQRNEQLRALKIYQEQRIASLESELNAIRMAARNKEERCDG